MNKSVIITAFHKFRNIEIFEGTNKEKMNDKEDSLRLNFKTTRLDDGVVVN